MTSYLHRSLPGIACLVLVLASGGMKGSTQVGVGVGQGQYQEDVRLARSILRVMELASRECVRDASLRELTAWLIEGLYQEQGGKVPLAVRERFCLMKEIEPEGLAALLRDACAGLDSHRTLDPDQELGRAVAHMLRRLDPHADFVNLERLCIQCGPSSVGIGVRLALDASKRWPQVVTPIKDGPAYKAGVQAGDIVTHITYRTDWHGQPLLTPEVTPTENLPLPKVERLLLARDGVTVRLGIRREGEGRPLELEVTHGRAETETVLGCRRKPDDTWEYFLDTERQIAYVRLTQFHRNTSRDLSRALGELSQQGLKGLVLDLRSNPGGLLKSAVEVADLFIDDGAIVTIQPRTGNSDRYLGKSEGSHRSFPMVCLINGASASGSEIVAGCLQDYRRAIVIGERSQGKGSVQILLPLDNHELKLTIAVFRRPLGRKLDRIKLPGADEEEWGVAPDLGYELKLSPADRVELTAHLDRMDVIPRRDRPARDERSVLRDRHRELALEYLRSQVRKD